MSLINKRLLKNKSIFVLGFFLLSTIYIKAQEDNSYNYEQYYHGFPFNEGVYLTFEDFKDNLPRITSGIDGRGGDLYIWNDSLEKMIPVYPNKVWGYSQSGNVYVSMEDGFWRIINIGSLSQFSAIVLTRFVTTDQFGFPVEQYSKNMKQLFLDMNNGNYYELTAKNLRPYIESEPLLEERFKKMRRVKDRELIMMLKAYNELHPLYFPVHE